MRRSRFCIQTETLPGWAFKNSSSIWRASPPRPCAATAGVGGRFGVGCGVGVGAAVGWGVGTALCAAGASAGTVARPL